MKTFMVLLALVFACFVYSVVTKHVCMATEARTRKRTLVISVFSL